MHERVKLYSKKQSWQSKAANGLLYQKEYNIVCEIYEDDFDVFDL